MEQQQVIALTIGSQTLSFVPTEVEYNDYMNEMMPANKVAPAHNFVFATVQEDDKQKLREITSKNPGAAMQIASAIFAEFAPELSIKVKK
ncbi:putative phage tail assembly chaperone [Photobacterium damselae]|uniref:putative phage tail assembly chaperone n=1 Tax=Photobacterium damselae TaxID=38293 RepID=UPI001EFE48AE|nr:putative phage tail assembly chaperone [Photobacterium damselae]MCG9778733.1 putative phage tail assembly chaperone [Photobacterium damselae]